MSLAVGTVAVDNAGNVTGSGAALAVFNSMWAARLPTLPNPAVPDPSFLAFSTPPSWYTGGASSWEAMNLGQQWAAIINHGSIGTKQDTAIQANGIAGLVAYLTTNGVVSVVISVGGLQNLPSTVTAGQPTAAPGTPVTLNGALT